jgi:hypothetical protein
MLARSSGGGLVTFVHSVMLFLTSGVSRWEVQMGAPEPDPSAPNTMA